MTDTDERMIREIARLCSLPESRVERTVTLLQGGATIPFITRYRKEVTGGLDEVQICVAYKFQGQEVLYPPQTPNALARVTPVYEKLPVCLTSPSGVPGPRRPAKKGWSRWLRC